MGTAELLGVGCSRDPGVPPTWEYEVVGICRNHILLCNYISSSAAAAISCRRENKNSQGQGHFRTWSGLPGLLLSRQGPVPKGRWAKWDARVPSGRGACPSFLLLFSLVVQLAKKAIAASLLTQTPLTIWSKTTYLSF